MSSRVRTILVVLVGLATLAFVANKLVAGPGALPPRDFAEYWSSGAANLHGENPYDPDVLTDYQRRMDPHRNHAVMMWNPPWSLTLYMLLGWLAPGWATLLWLVLQLAAVVVSCDLLWKTFGGPLRFRWVAQLVGLWAAVKVVNARAWALGVALLLALLAILAVSNIWVFGHHEFYWVTPAVLVVYLVAVLRSVG